MKRMTMFFSDMLTLTSAFRSEGSESWRGPTLPWLEPKYHRRGGLSGSSSEWDRLYLPRYTHQLSDLLGQKAVFSAQYSVFSVQKEF